MSINAILTSDKANFSNYFSDPIVMPGNSQVALTTASITLPYFVQNVLIPPILETEDERTSFALRVNIDGIAKSISWREIYNAYRSYGGIVSLEPNLTEDLFFGGSYEIFTNNKITCSSAPANAARDGEKPTINWALATAIDAEFEFYAVSDASTWTEPKVSWIANNAEGTVQRRTLTSPLATFNDCEFSLSNCTEIALNVSYMPGKITDLAPTVGALAPQDVKNMVYTDAGSFLTTTAAGAQEECMGAGNGIDIDVNGGYIRCSPNIATSNGKLWFGLSLEGRGNSATNRYLPIATANPAMMDVGFEFSQLAGGEFVYRMIDGRTVNNVYDGGVATNIYSPTYYPNQSVKLFDNDTDGFALLIRRGNIINGNFEYVFDFYVGDDDDAIQAWTCIYSSKTTLNRSGIRPVPLFLGSANVAGNQFKNIQFIVNGIDTSLQGEALLDYDGGFYNAVSIQPYTNLGTSQEKNFWKAIGLNSMDTEMQPGPGAVDYNDGVIKVSYSGTPLNKTIRWKPNFRDGDNDGSNSSYYYIGHKAVNRFYSFDANGLLEVNNDYLLGSLPKYLNVYLLNVPVKNYSGTYPTGFSGNGAESETGENRIIGTMPFVYPADTEISNDLDIFYETFNAYYRPVNNNNSYTLNDMLIEISFKDFNTDRRITIEDVIGTIKVELNIKGGVQQNVGRATRHNDLVPII